ncbi:MAG: hypothetical protein JNL02_18270 [Saprospiraceae bacterium]|nr:hypothetical protein [Saprospiraceae bacterium]
MKALTLILFAGLLLHGNALAQSKNPEEIIADIVTILKSDNPEKVTSMYLTDLNLDKESTENFNGQFRYVHDNYGNCEGFEIVEKTKHSESVMSYTCVFKYKLPLIFKFIFYRYEGKWKITYFFFSDKVAKNLGVDQD